MDATDARDHVRMLDGIVRATDRTVHVSPAVLIGIGAVCATITGLIQARQMGWNIPPDHYIQPPAFLVMLVIIAVAAWRHRDRGRDTLVDGYAGIAFFAAAAVGLTLNVTAQDRVIPPAGIGLVWAGSFSMALLIIGAMGSRVLFVGAVAMLAAVGVAALVPGWLPGILAIAWIVGFAIPGLVLALGAPHGRTAAL
jgi:hypothetical protein